MFTDSQKTDLRTLDGIERPSNFVVSLLDTARRKGRLSEKQWHWVSKIARETRDGRRAGPAVVEGIDLSELNETMKTARSRGRKFPKINLRLAGLTVQLSLAGAGHINVTDGGPYGENVWYGRIADGRWTKGRAHPAALATVEGILRRLQDDPSAVALAHSACGSCCFCSKTLTVGESVRRGYGPTCAKLYGLEFDHKLYGQEQRAARKASQLEECPGNRAEAELAETQAALF